MLDAPQKEAIERVATRHAHPAGTVLMHEGASARSVLILRSGRVKVVATGRNGRRALLAIRIPGDVIGEMSAVDGRPRSATVVALDPVQLLRVPDDSFARLLAGQPGVALGLLAVVVGRLRLANMRRTEYGDTTVADRLTVLLTELAERHGEMSPTGITLGLPVGQEELAEMVGGSREAVVRALRALRKDGILATGRRRITILQPELLGYRA